MDLEGVYEIVKNLRNDFLTFKSNDFLCLEKKVDKISTKVAWIMGVIGGIFTIANILIRFL